MKLSLCIFVFYMDITLIKYLKGIMSQKSFFTSKLTASQSMSEAPQEKLELEPGTAELHTVLIVLIRICSREVYYQNTLKFCD